MINKFSLNFISLNLAEMKRRNQAAHWYDGCLKSGLSVKYVREIVSWIKTNPSVPSDPWHLHYGEGLIMSDLPGIVNTATRGADIPSGTALNNPTPSIKCSRDDLCSKQWLGLSNNTQNEPFSDKEIKGLISEKTNKEINNTKSLMEREIEEAYRNKKGMKTWDEFKKEARIRISSSREMIKRSFQTLMTELINNRNRIIELAKEGRCCPLTELIETGSTLADLFDQRCKEFDMLVTNPETKKRTLSFIGSVIKDTIMALNVARIQMKNNPNIVDKTTPESEINNIINSLEGVKNKYNA